MGIFGWLLNEGSFISCLVLPFHPSAFYTTCDSFLFILFPSVKARKEEKGVRFLTVSLYTISIKITDFQVPFCCTDMHRAFNWHGVRVWTSVLVCKKGTALEMAQQQYAMKVMDRCRSVVWWSCYGGQIAIAGWANVVE